MKDILNTPMSDVLIGTTAMIVSAVVGSILTAWAQHRSQLLLLDKQIQLNKEMHAQLLRDQAEIQQKMEQDRRNYERSQEMHREARQMTRPG